MECSFNEDQLLSSLLYNDKKLYFNKFEWLAINSFSDCISKNSNKIISIPNQYLFLPIVVNAVLKEYLFNYKFSDNITKRVSTLIITSKKNAVNFIKEFKINSKLIVESSLKKRKFFQDNNIFCDMDNPYFAQVYWNDILKKYYNLKIPQYLPFAFTFPIATGYVTFNEISRGNRNIIGRKDNVQQSVIYITDNPKLLSKKELENYFDYIFVDYSKINVFCKSFL